MKLRGIIELVVLAGLAASIGGCRQDVQFTKPPVVGGAHEEGRTRASTLFLGLRLDQDALATAIVDALPDDTIRVSGVVRGSDCRSSARGSCRSAGVRGVLRRAGAPVLKAADDRLLVDIPFDYDLKAGTFGRRQRATDDTSGRIVVTAGFKVSLGPDFEVEVERVEPIATSAETVTLLGAGFALGRALDPQLSRSLKEAGEALQRHLSALPLRDVAARGWRRLHAPVALGASGLWRRAEPLSIASGGFRAERGQLFYRLAVAARIAPVVGERPVPLFVTPLPEASLKPAEPLVTQLELSYRVPMSRMVEAVRAALPAGTTLPLGAGGTKGQLKARRVAVYPSQNRIAIELRADVDTAEGWLGMKGLVHLLGRPHVEPGKRTLRLTNVQFAPTRASPAVFRNGRFILADVPLAARLGEGVRLQLDPQLSQFVARTLDGLDHDQDGGLRVTGAFGDWRVESVLPSRKELRIALVLSGALMLRETGPITQSGRVVPSSALDIRRTR
ncbi:MAG: DUF4403 family protein [Hyphomicrobiaceae bacterium]|nr:DUF4403 family protein [Hyphomicrobiaceae bacterium]